MKFQKNKQDIDFIYASSAVNVRDNKQNLNELIEKVMVADDYASAFAFFVQSGIGSEDEDFSTSLDRKSAELYEFLAEVTDQSSEPIISYLRVGYTALVLKSAIKSHIFGGASGDKSDFERSVDAMVRENSFSALGSESLAVAAESALTQASASRDPQVVDTLIDSASFTVKNELAANSGIPYLRDISAMEIDITNINTVFRLKRLGVSPLAADSFVYEGGNIKKEDVILLLFDKEKAVYRIRKSMLGETVKELTEDDAAPSVCETTLNRLYYDKLKASANIPYGAEKVIAYALLYEKQIRDLRIILTGKKVGIPPERIRERL